MKKQIKVVDLTSKLQNSTSCGVCEGLKEILPIGDANDKAEAKGCHGEVEKTSKICARFRPNPAILKSAFSTKSKAENMMLFSKIVKNIPTDQLQVMTMLLMREQETRAEGFNFLQRVIVRYLGTARANYISNFMSCRVLRADKNMIHLISEDGKVELRYHIKAMRESIFTVAQYKELHKVMKAKGKFVDPKLENQSIPDSRYPLRNEDGTDAEILITDDAEKGKVSNMSDVTDNPISQETSDLVDILQGTFTGRVIRDESGAGFDFDSMFADDDIKTSNGTDISSEEGDSQELSGQVEVEL